MSIGEVNDVSSLAAYQPASVVSRTLIKSKAGTVTTFAFDAGQELSEHTAPFDALVHVIDGQGEFAIDGKPHVVAAGQLLLLPANRPHAVRAKQQFKMILTMIRAAGEASG